MKFKQEFTYEKRVEESYRVLTKFPDMLPIVCEKSSFTSKECPDIDKKKYLVPKDLTVGQFLYIVRKRLVLPPEKAIFLFVEKTIPPSAAFIIDIYNIYKDKDGFLYIEYGFENVFG